MVFSKRKPGPFNSSNRPKQISCDFLSFKTSSSFAVCANSENTQGLYDVATHGKPCWSVARHDPLIAKTWTGHLHVDDHSKLGWISGIKSTMKRHVAQSRALSLGMLLHKCGSRKLHTGTGQLANPLRYMSNGHLLNGRSRKARTHQQQPLQLHHVTLISRLQPSPCMP